MQADRNGDYNARVHGDCVTAKKRRRLQCGEGGQDRDDRKAMTVSVEGATAPATMAMTREAARTRTTSVIRYIGFRIDRKVMTEREGGESASYDGNDSEARNKDSKVTPTATAVHKVEQVAYPFIVGIY